MTPTSIVQAAIPSAAPEVVDHILFGRTPFPCGSISPRQLYKAADRWRRAGAAGRQLCDFCDNQVTTHRWTCDRCQSGLDDLIATPEPSP